MRGRGWASVLVVLAVAGLAACGGRSSGDRDDGVLTIAGCQIQPKTSCVAANLSGASLRGAELNSSNLERSTLAHSDLSDADLRSANLTSTLITNADLRGTDLSKAKLDGANLTGSNLTDAYLRGAVTNHDVLAGTIRCRTTRPDGAIDNTSCPPTPASTTTSPTTTTMKPGPKPTAPTTTTTKPPPPTTAAPAPPCALNLLQAGYVAKFGLPPDGTTFSLTACVSGYAGTNLSNPDIGNAFAVYRVQGSSWVALNVGSTGVCDNLGIPPLVQQQIGCV